MNAVFEGLPDIKNVIPRSSNDTQLFKDLAEVLNRHGAIDRFGITLLHTHFPVEDGEVLLESSNVPSRTQEIRPVQMKTCSGLPMVETAWRLNSVGKPLLSCWCATDAKGDHTGQHQVRGGIKQ